MKGYQIISFSLIVIFIFGKSVCGPQYEYQIPDNRDDGWVTTSLEEVGIDQNQIIKFLDRINSGQYENIHSILIVKDGKLVLEQYFPGYTYDFWGEDFKGDYTEFNIDTPHNQASATKIYTSALVGIAIDQGFIEDVDDKVFAYFPGYNHLMDETKQELTLEHLLTMTSGFKWNQGDLPITDERNDITQVHIADDPTAYILAKPMVAEPGRSWYYSEGDVNLLGEIIQSATGLRLDEFADQFLFQPLGITQVEWKPVNPDFVWASGDLKMKLIDMAKLGYLYLNGGIWNDKKVLSETWTRASTEAYTEVPNPAMAEFWGDRYGYH